MYIYIYYVYIYILCIYIINNILGGCRREFVVSKENCTSLIVHLPRSG